MNIQKSWQRTWKMLIDNNIPHVVTWKGKDIEKITLTDCSRELMERVGKLPFAKVVGS